MTIVVMTVVFDDDDVDDDDQIVKVNYNSCGGMLLFWCKDWTKVGDDSLRENV